MIIQFLVVFLFLAGISRSLAWSKASKVPGPLQHGYDEFEYIVDRYMDAVESVQIFNEIKSGLAEVKRSSEPLLEKMGQEHHFSRPSLQGMSDKMLYDKRALATNGVTDDDEVYENPDDKYTPSSNVENGAAISGVNFATDAVYFQTILVKPILLFCMGFVALFFFNLGLCCRCCCTCCSCKPKEDIDEKELAHQKFMITCVEVLLIFSVLLADTLCYYGYGYMQEGVASLNDGFDGLSTILDNVLGVCYELYQTDAPNLSSSTDAAKISCPNGATILSTMDVFNVALNSAAKLLYDAVKLLGDNVDLAKESMNAYVDNYLRVFVFLIWSFAALSTFWFVLFRLFKSECGTMFAVFWGELTFLIILLVNVPLLIFTQILGDFCVQPTHNIIQSQGDGDLKEMVRYYSHCTGNDTIGEKLDNVVDSMQDLANATTTLMGMGIGCSSDSNLAAMASTITAAGDRFTAIGGYISCSNFQAIYFTIVNDAFCGGFYSGIYSLWVSQFITSFFLFFLIVVASISYQYFHPTMHKRIAPVPDEDEDYAANKPVEAVLVNKPLYDKEEQGFGGAAPSGGAETGGNVEMSELVGDIDSQDII